MLANRRDHQATFLARKSKKFEDSRSYITNAGHEYLFGIDLKRRRAQVFRDANNTCQICGKHLPGWHGDLEHIEGKIKQKRCSCYNTVLADGTIHTNLRRSCKMTDQGGLSCHALKHGRVLKSGKR